MPMFKILDIMIFELIDQYSPVEMFVVCPVITSWQSILSTLLDDAVHLHLHFFVICMDMLSKSKR